MTSSAACTILKNISLIKCDFLPPLCLLTLLKDPIYVINILGECARFINAHYHLSSKCAFSVSETNVKQRPLFTIQSIYFRAFFCHLTFCFT